MKKRVAPSVQQTPPASQFAPTDYTDGRPFLDWRTKYPIEARRKILQEAIYTGAVFLVSVVAIVFFFVPTPGGGPANSHLKGCFLAWFGGMVGGSLFSIKWLYHCVAKQTWHEDRYLWRVFTPPMSGGVAFITFILAASGLLNVIDEKLIENPFQVLGFSFLTGYFSDKALAKLANLADTLFGATWSLDHAAVPDAEAVKRGGIVLPGKDGKAPPKKVGGAGR